MVSSIVGSIIPSRLYHLGQSGTWSNGNKSVLQIPQAPELEPYYQMV